MKNCKRMLVAAVMGMSMSAGAFAQSAQNGTGAAGTGAAGDAMGNQTAAQGRDMQRGASNDADAKMMAQLDKIAGMGEKAGDALFVLASANGNLFEVEAAKAAQQKSKTASVKELAMMIQKDHAEANEKLKPIAQKMGLEFPTQLPGEKQKMLAIAGAMSDQDFDTHYVLHMKADHAMDITSFADHQKAVKDEDLRNYISMVLPKLKEHGAHVQMLASEMGYASPMGGGTMGGDMGGMKGDTKGDAKGMDHGNMGGAANPPANNPTPANR